MNMHPLKAAVGGPLGPGLGLGAGAARGGRLLGWLGACLPGLGCPGFCSSWLAGCLSAGAAGWAPSPAVRLSGPLLSDDCWIPDPVLPTPQGESRGTGAVLGSLTCD